MTATMTVTAAAATSTAAAAVHAATAAVHAASATAARHFGSLAVYRSQVSALRGYYRSSPSR